MRASQGLELLRTSINVKEARYTPKSSPWKDLTPDGVVGKRETWRGEVGATCRRNRMFSVSYGIKSVAVNVRPSVAFQPWQEHEPAQAHQGRERKPRATCGDERGTKPARFMRPEQRAETRGLSAGPAEKNAKARRKAVLAGAKRRPGGQVTVPELGSERPLMPSSASLAAARERCVPPLGSLHRATGAGLHVCVFLFRRGGPGYNGSGGMESPDMGTASPPTLSMVGLMGWVLSSVAGHFQLSQTRCQSGPGAENGLRVGTSAEFQLIDNLRRELDKTQDGQRGFQTTGI